MEGVSFKMVKFRLPLNIKKFDIREPKNSFALGKRIDLAIVPTLGVDGAFRRIGFGKGMYDRFFQSLPYRPKIAFVELDDCFTASHVGESHDIQADIYITPYKTRKRGQR
jgi:5-formyltetrahydrofolate cyclo-ligase